MVRGNGHTLTYSSIQGSAVTSVSFNGHPHVSRYKLRDAFGLPAVTVWGQPASRLACERCLAFGGNMPPQKLLDEIRSALQTAGSLNLDLYTLRRLAITRVGEHLRKRDADLFHRKPVC